jgi:hypothetical protein
LEGVLVGVLDINVDKTIQHLGEIKGRATGEWYSDGGFVFCSMTEVADWLVAQKVALADMYVESMQIGWLTNLHLCAHI